MRTQAALNEHEMFGILVAKVGRPLPNSKNSRQPPVIVTLSHNNSVYIDLIIIFNLKLFDDAL